MSTYPYADDKGNNEFRSTSCSHKDLTSVLSLSLSLSRSLCAPLSSFCLFERFWFHISGSMCDLLHGSGNLGQGDDAEHDIRSIVLPFAPTRRDLFFACSLASPPICHPTGVRVVRAPTSSPTRSSSSFSVGVCAIYPHLTRTPVSWSSLRVAHLDRRVALYRRPSRSSPTAPANQGGAGSKRRPAPTPKSGAWTVVRSRTSHGAPTSRTPATQPHCAWR